MNNEKDHGQPHILVVDDEETLRYLIREGVEKSGYGCSVASDGLEALKILEEKGADVVISDIMMPGMDGIELATRIKEEHDADVILITGFIDEYSYDKVIEIGVSDFLEKPIGIDELILRLRRVLRERTNIRERNRAEEELRDSLKKLRTAMESTVEALVLAIEKKDPYTSGHQKRVATLAGAIAKEMGLPQDQIDGVRMAAMTHDIGKNAIPGQILSKPAELTKLEMGMIEEHPQIGYDILKGIEFPWPVAQMVLQHHERTDGSGYPQGLLGDEIYLGAKILGVADVVEAMVSHRPYRASLGLDSAMDEISKNRGILYDPDVVDAGLRLLREKGFEF
ncbi:MAG: response regulator [Desulfobacteraceae bacterium]|nr:response regulator [Desulfobacteraceae bacterium]